MNNIVIFLKEFAKAMNDHSRHLLYGLKSRTLLLLLFLVTFLALLPTAAAQDETGFGAQDGDAVRIESEIKLKVPLQQSEDVWEWLQRRYTDASWLDRDGANFYASFGDEDFTDIYFDTPNLVMLAEQSGVRHRSRIVHSGPASEKDERELLQLKLNREDPTGVARSEIKFDVSPRARIRTNEDVHPMLGLIGRTDREQLKALFQSWDINPNAMQPVLTLEQNRRRVYISDQAGAFATLTLDLCSTSSWGTDLHWAEMELELNEIRYTQADQATRLWMEQLIATIQSDLQQAFPEIVQDQTPKYNTAFDAIEAQTWLPVRFLIRWGLSMSDFMATVAVGGLALLGLAWYGAARWNRRRRRLAVTEEAGSTQESDLGSDAALSA